MGMLSDDDSVTQGLSQAWLDSGSEPTSKGLGKDLLGVDPQIGRLPISSISHAGDVLLALKHLANGAPTLSNMLAPAPALPSLAPPAIGESNLPQRVTLPGQPSASNMSDQAALQDIIESRRPDLGAEGNFIRACLHPGFSRDMFQSYWQGNGDQELSDERFRDIADYTNTLKPGKAGQVTGPDGEPLEWRQYKLYGSPDYTRSLGTSTLFYDRDGNPAGFYDTYNFDPATGKRSWEREAETRIMHALPQPASAKAFKITYGKFVPMN